MLLFLNFFSTDGKLKNGFSKTRNLLSYFRVKETIRKNELKEMWCVIDLFTSSSGIIVISVMFI